MRFAGLRWMIAAAAAAQAVAGPALAADLERGEELFALCTQCHAADGGGNEMALAPAIAGLDDWYLVEQLNRFQNGMRGTHFDDIAGMRMRPMSLWLRTDEDVAAVAAYVASLPKTTPAATLEGGDAARGKALYTPCIACHAADGSGNPALKGAPLANQADWYLAKSLDSYRTGVRGSSPNDQSGALMRAMAVTLTSEQAVKDVVAHILTLSH